jgi:hypothetical protein
MATPFRLGLRLAATSSTILSQAACQRKITYKSITYKPCQEVNLADFLPAYSAFTNHRHKKKRRNTMGEWVAPKRASGAGKTRRNLLMVIAA